MKIAIIGTGISGLCAAWLLHTQHDITIYEQNNYVGGHSQMITVKTDEGIFSIDTGFLLYNELNYPNLSALFNYLNIKTHQMAMSFSMSLDQGKIEYAGSDLNTLFGQRRNLFNPDFYLLLWDILRFNREGKALLANKNPSVVTLTLGDFLQRGGYSQAFRLHYLLPMSATIWSCPANKILSFPALTLLRFFHNHGLLTLSDRPLWQTIEGGTQRYIQIITADIRDKLHLSTPATAITRHPTGCYVYDALGNQNTFDAVVIATHADQALTLLTDPSDAEQQLLSCFKYQKNRAVLHTDILLMPLRRRIWSAWNYIATTHHNQIKEVSVTYWINRLQFLPTKQAFFLSFNPQIEPQHPLHEINYQYPIFDSRAIIAQGKLKQLQGQQNTWYCGSYFNNGFHEDALNSGLAVANALGIKPMWQCQAVG
ncbi:NAD(P)/FAD-dependent oxidoreductase [Beggiatoa leptomitoformis]|uniref:NAD(P)-binding protein n=1 Tax=Beggiatoa leptomitoformis TaxID=288004 RepID=A0A650GDZ1_9GAMM|nr:FAD-dependent oxidoreductase [Beggiatoa leptomitoformis]ALG69090.1 NAD(P)-binding protein [Beggiatoa leptomitoformis]QGX04141.1 NAD(P)-binding protein [Beggiatoa leptomitoformis]